MRLNLFLRIFKILNKREHVIMEYKGYEGSQEFSKTDNVYFGRILYIDDLVNYEAETKEDLKKEFELAVEGYINESFPQSV